MPRSDRHSGRRMATATDLPVQIGVGLRHAHYQDALSGASCVDFIEIHAENFFAAGGLTPHLLDDINDRYNISLHATSMGPGSAAGINPDYLQRLKQLVDHINPWLISDHACFSWSNGAIHAGDLLPLEFNQPALDILIRNVDHAQQRLGRSILIENISSYLPPMHATMTEVEFLLSLVEHTQCGLLVDLNNLLVNAHNRGSQHPLEDAMHWLQQIPDNIIGEFHLAGSTPVAPHALLIDDHAQPVSDPCWTLYQFATERFGAVPTLIEWDNNLPSWQTLLDQADIAKHLSTTTLSRDKRCDHAS